MIEAIFDFLEKHPDIVVSCDYEAPNHKITVHMIGPRKWYYSRIINVDEVKAEHPDDFDGYIELVLLDLFRRITAET